MIFIILQKGSAWVKFILRVKIAYSVISVGLVLMGLCFAFFPEISALTICYCVGAISVVFGIIKLMGYFSNDVYRLAFQFDLAIGIAMILCGAVIVIRPRMLIAMLPVILGVLVLIDGLFKIQTALDSKRFGMKKWWISLTFGILASVIGVFLILDPFEGNKILTVLLGITLIVDGVQNLWMVLYTVKSKKAKDEAVIRTDFDN